MVFTCPRHSLIGMLYHFFRPFPEVSLADIFFHLQDSWLQRLDWWICACKESTTWLLEGFIGLPPLRLYGFDDLFTLRIQILIFYMAVLDSDCKVFGFVTNLRWHGGSYESNSFRISSFIHVELGPRSALLCALGQFLCGSYVAAHEKRNQDCCA